jgi:hypothetical protein
LPNTCSVALSAMRAAPSRRPCSNPSGWRPRRSTCSTALAPACSLIIRGDDDPIVPIGAAALLSAKLVPKAQLKIYKGGSHRICTTEKDRVNADLLAFIKG